MTIPNQKNYQQLLGYGIGTIKSYGCTLACLSAISGIEILKLNKMLKGTSFINSSFAGATKNLINWTKLNQYTNGVINHIRRGYGYDSTKVMEAIAKHGFCLIEVLNAGTKHWIIAIGNKKALDPLTGGKIPTNKYGTWTGWSELEVKKGETNMPELMQIENKDFEKLMREAGEKDKTIDGLEIDIIKKENEIRRLKTSLEENSGQITTQDSEIATLGKQVSAYKGEVTKKENEIIELNKKLTEKPSGYFIGKRKMLVGILTPITVAIVKIVSTKLGVELDPQEMLYLILAGLAYIGVEGAKDLTVAVKTIENSDTSTK